MLKIHVQELHFPTVEVQAGGEESEGDDDDGDARSGTNVYTDLEVGRRY